MMSGKENKIALIDFVFPYDLGKTNTASSDIESIKGAGIERKIGEIISNGRS